LQDDEHGESLFVEMRADTSLDPKRKIRERQQEELPCYIHRQTINNKGADAKCCGCSSGGGGTKDDEWCVISESRERFPAKFQGSHHDVARGVGLIFVYSATSRWRFTCLNLV
jgi:hypothetical protein